MESPLSCAVLLCLGYLFAFCLIPLKKLDCKTVGLIFWHWRREKRIAESSNSRDAKWRKRRFSHASLTRVSLTGCLQPRPQSSLARGRAWRHPLSWSGRRVYAAHRTWSQTLDRQLPRSISTIMLGNEAITFHFLARSRLSLQRARVDATYNTKNADIFAIYYKVFFITRSMLHMKRKTFIRKPTLSPVRPEIVPVERLKKSWIRCLWLRWINCRAA